MEKIKKDNFFWSQVQINVKKAQYAVRGQIPTLADKIKEEIHNSEKNPYSFTEITSCNIGNPQAFGQKPITFNREVLSCLVNPDLIENDTINEDARKRAKVYLDEIVSAGVYTHAMGVKSVRQSVSRFIAEHDSVPEPSIENILLTEGASQGATMLMNCLITDSNDAVMASIPQYAMYAALIDLFGATPAPYYLDEQKGWGLTLEELERSYNEATKAGKKVKALIMINPGNPTGGVFDKETIQTIIKFATERRIVIITDEVYRENVWAEDAKFHSCRSVLQTMPQEIKDHCELASLHSVSKGMLGECGFRGGYLYLHNFNPEVTKEIIKLKSISLCSNTVGQFMVDLMVNPPLQGVSESTKKKYQEEYAELFNYMKQRGKIVTEALNSMKNITCNEMRGSVDVFPRVRLSNATIKAAGDVEPDMFYCTEVLKNTGIAMVPGCGFRQKPGTYHFRLTMLVRPEAKLREKLEVLKKYNDEFHEKYADKE